MKKALRIAPILAVLFLGILSSCVTDIDSLELISTEAVAIDLAVKATTAKGIDSRSNKAAPTEGVNLGLAGEFAILTKSGITNVYRSNITGDVGTSPITGAALLLRCEEVTGNIYTVDAAGPLACRITAAPRLTTAVGDMQTAFTDAAGRSNPDFLNLGAGIIGGQTLEPGLYKWTSTLLIPADITLEGGPNDVWIFQVAGTLTMSSAVKMILSEGAQANNIFWQVSGAVTLGTTSHFEGSLLGKTSIAVQTGATVNGRLLAQTAVTLQMNTVNLPKIAPPVLPPPPPLLASIGDFRDGGVVFWVNPEDNTHGLVSSLENQSDGIAWSANGDTIGTWSRGIGSGSENTTAIIDAQQRQNIPLDSYAAGLARAYRGGGFEDWYLPNIEELTILSEQLDYLEQIISNPEYNFPEIFDFSNGNYWTSSESEHPGRSKKIASTLNIRYNILDEEEESGWVAKILPASKNQPRKVRAIRAF
jgi:hypothetical protein